MHEYWINTDVNELPTVQMFCGVVFRDDEEANKIGVIVTDNGEAVELEGDVSATIIKPDGSTITENGSKSGNSAWVVLPSSAYSAAGKISVFIKITNGTEVSTLGGIEAYVYPV